MVPFSTLLARFLTVGFRHLIASVAVPYTLMVSGSPPTSHRVACFMGFELFHIPHLIHGGRKPTATSLYKLHPVLSFSIYHICILVPQLSHFSSLVSSFFLLLFLSSTLMASKKVIQPKIPRKLDESEVCTTMQTYAGYHWHLEAILNFLSSLISTYSILEKVVFEVLGPQEGAIDDKSYASHVALFPSMFSYWLRLPFPHPVRDVLDCLELAPF